MCTRLYLSVVYALVFCATFVAAAPPAMRRWSDRTGKFTTEAEFVEVMQDAVVLKNAAGKQITVPLARLSDADRQYVQSLATPAAKPPNGDAARKEIVFPDAVTEPPSWNNANTPFDLAAFLKAPPPDENAAPLYLEALYEFAPREMVDILYPDLSLEESKRLYDKHRPLSQETRRLEEAWEKDPKSVDGKDVDAWLTNFNVGFEKLAAAQRRPKCQFQPGRSLHSLWPHVQATRAVARTIAWRTRRDLERGDLERPLQDLQMLLRLSRDLQVRGGFIAHIVAFALDARCCELMQTILNAPGINTKHCDRLLALLAEHEAKSIDAFVEGNRAEYIGCRQMLHDLQHRTGSFDSKTLKEVFDIRDDLNSPLACIKVFADLTGQGPENMAKVTIRFQGKLQPGAWKGGKMLSDEEYAKEVAALNRFFATILALAERPDFPLKADADIEAAEKLIEETTLVTFLIPSENGFIRTIRRNDALKRGTQCLIALRRWQLEHEDPPADLETLVKAAGMPGVPTDPYSGQPLRLGSIAGKPVIYSVGPDGKDDQAQVGSNPYTDDPGDYIFRLETPLQ